MNKPSEEFLRGVWHHALVTGLLLAAPCASSAQDRVQVAFQLTATHVTTSEPVYVLLSIANGLRETVRFDPPLDRDTDFDLSVVDPSGSVATPEPLSRGGLRRTGTVVLRPEATYSRTLLISERYQFKRPGEYVLKMSLSGSIRTVSGKPLNLPPQELRLRVAPREVTRLDQICQALANTASTASSYEAQSDAALALNFVADPVAVPYLGQVIARQSLASDIAVEGLVRIGTPEAVQVLKSNLDTADSLLRMRIQGALEEIRSGVHPQVMD